MTVRFAPTGASGRAEVDEATGRQASMSAIGDPANGTAGRAVPSINVALSLPESLGLSTNGVAP
ncbi:hypothetical protein ABCR94_12725 [Streptomyces sp. 21So2-11]|uniref:hypothetical protein n=1 Tax=Streptomyces sp. 21So2-11 TaxID=3144408 RepID=UPI00321AB353